MEADLERAPRFARRIDRRERGGHVERDRLLAEDVLAGGRRAFDHLDVERRRCRDDDAVDLWIGEKILVARRPVDVQLLTGRTGTCLVGVDDADERGRRHRPREVLGVHEADASEAGHAQADPTEPDFPLARGFGAHRLSGLATFS